MKKQFKYDLVIVGGLGHVGLPLGLVFASKDLQVCLNDINEDIAKKVQNGQLPYVEYGAESLLKKALESGNLKVSLDPESISEAKYVIIATGTPVDEYLNPKNCQFLLGQASMNVNEGLPKYIVNNLNKEFDLSKKWLVL
mgnify:CR=1 FL=1